VVQSRRSAALLVLLTILTSTQLVSSPNRPDSESAAGRNGGEENAVSMPPILGTAGSFEPNVGQISDATVRFTIRSGSFQARFTEDSVLLNLHSIPPAGPNSPGFTKRVESTGPPRGGISLRVSFPGAAPVVPIGRGDIGGVSHYLHGADLSGSSRGVPRYSEVYYESIYAGVDLAYQATDRGLKYEFHVRPGHDPSSITVRYEGIQSLDVAQDSLVLHTTLGDLRDELPYSYEGEHMMVSCRYDQRTEDSFGFLCPTWSGLEPLVIDPLLYATFLGGGGEEYPFAMVADPRGGVYVVGQTTSVDFPTTPGAYKELSTSVDAFVARIGGPPTYALDFATYFGGSGYEQAMSIALDPAGNVLITGSTDSADFPTTPGAWDTSIGSYEAFIVKLDPTGSVLLYSSFLGGTAGDEGLAVVTDDAGAVYVAGGTNSIDFQTSPGALDEELNNSDAFVLKLSATGSLVYSTFLGGTGFELAESMRVDTGGYVYLVGLSGSDDFPTTSGAVDTIREGSWGDAFVAKLSPDGGSLIFSTYLGGSGDEQWISIDIDNIGNAFVAGATSSDNFPTTAAAFDTEYGGGPPGTSSDGFVVKISPTGTQMLYGTYLGGNGPDEARGIAVDAGGVAYVAGGAGSFDFPVTSGAFDVFFNSSMAQRDAFVAKIDASGSALLYSSFLGGEDLEAAYAIALAPPSASASASCRPSAAASDAGPVASRLMTCRPSGDATTPYNCSPPEACSAIAPSGS